VLVGDDSHRLDLRCRAGSEVEDVKVRVGLVAYAAGGVSMNAIVFLPSGVTFSADLVADFLYQTGVPLVSRIIA